MAIDRDDRAAYMSRRLPFMRTRHMLPNSNIGSQDRLQLLAINRNTVFDTEEGAAAIQMTRMRMGLPDLSMQGF